MNKAWIPEGHALDLFIEHRSPHGAAVPFVAAKPKIIWHTTEGMDLESMHTVLTNKHAEPHFLIGKHGTGRRDYTVIQYFPLDVGSRALQNNTADGYPTNAARCIQIEVCEFAENAQNWDYDLIYALARLTRYIERRVHVPRVAPRAFTIPARRYTDQGFVNATGHFGHCHVPDNDHWDPGRFPIRKLFRQCEKFQHHG